MRKGMFGVLAMAALLAGCGEKKQVDMKNASAGEVAGKVGEVGLHFQPGAWETTVKMTDFSSPGISPEMAAAMKQVMARQEAEQGHMVRTCLTPEKAAKPDSTFFGKGDRNCTYKSFMMGDGKIAGTMTCGDAKQAVSTITMNGTYTADSYTMDMGITGGMQGQTVSMRMTASSHRVGDCKPGDKTAA